MKKGIEKFVRGILIGSVIFTLSSTPIKQKKLPQFFVCNTWEDNEPYDKIPQFWEFKGVNKKYYRADEPILLVGKFSKKEKIGLILKNGYNRIIEKSRRQVRFDTSYVKREYYPWELFDKRGAGTYTAEWYIGKKKIGKIKFNLLESLEPRK